MRATVPDTVGYLPFQLGGLLISVAVTLMLLRALARRGLPPHLAAVWGWSPFVQLEAVNNAHVDVLGGALILAAGMLLVGRQAAPLRGRLRGRRRNETHSGHRRPRTAVPAPGPVHRRRGWHLRAALRSLRR